MTPDFSPAMLKAFLRARVKLVALTEKLDLKTGQVGNVLRAEASEKSRIRRAAGISKVQFDLAWMGNTLSLPPRAALWAALDVDPAQHGVELVEGGQKSITRRFGR